MPRLNSKGSGRSNQGSPATITFKNGQVWTEMQVRDFLAGIRAAMKVDDPFPIDLEDIAPLAYVRRRAAEQAMMRLGFQEGIDYKIDQGMSGVNSAPVGATLQGRPGKRFMISVRAAEHMIIAKVPQVREVYRKVFHEWFDAQETRAKLEWDRERSEGKGVRKSVCGIYAAHGVKGHEFGDVTNGTYRGLFRRDATRLKVDHHVPAGGNLRDHLPAMRLTVTRMAEQMTGTIVEDQNIQGGPAITDLAYDVGDDLRQACVQIRNKPRRGL